MGSTIKLPKEETRNSVLGNLFISSGEPGPVLKIQCKGRTGPKNLVTCMREILAEAWPSETLGLGGIFRIVNGKAKFYEMDAPLNVLSVLVSRDPGLDLRVDHSHGWGE